MLTTASKQACMWHGCSLVFIFISHMNNGNDDDDDEDDSRRSRRVLQLEQLGN